MKSINFVAVFTLLLVSSASAADDYKCGIFFVGNDYGSHYEDGAAEATVRIDGLKNVGQLFSSPFFYAIQLKSPAEMGGTIPSESNYAFLEVGMGSFPSAGNTVAEYAVAFAPGAHEIRLITSVGKTRASLNCERI